MRITEPGPVRARRSDHAPARQALVAACRREPITLVLGAGIPSCRGVPLWRDVVQRLWSRTAGRSRDWGGHPLEAQLALEWIEARLEDADARAAVLDGLASRAQSPISIAQSCYEALARDRAEDCDPRDLFVALLREALYEEVDDHEPDPHDALSVVGGIVRAEHARWPDRRLARIVTLNADDLLEHEVATHDDHPRLWPIVRASQHPHPGDPSRGVPPPIPVYHLHGYLPRDPYDAEQAPDTLVFTDDQFWDTTASPVSFANRVMANALHDTECVFAGLSMHDVNLMRWLGTRYNEVVHDTFEKRRRMGHPRDARGAAQNELERHFWIRTADDDPTGLISDVVARRGLRSVELPSWEGSAFADLMRECFAYS